MLKLKPREMMERLLICLAHIMLVTDMWTIHGSKNTELLLNILRNLYMSSLLQSVKDPGIL